MNKYQKALNSLDRQTMSSGEYRFDGKTIHQEEIRILQDLLDSCCFLKEEIKDKYGIAKTIFIETPAINTYQIKGEDYEG